MENITKLYYYVSIIMKNPEMWDDLFLSKDLEAQAHLVKTYLMKLF